MYEQNCFITLTYDNEHLPEDGSLKKRHFQLFMKRLRKYFPNSKIRYFHCGEYGAKLARPHYHAILFNFDFLDKVFHSQSGDNRLYTSEVLSKIWAHGFCIIGSVSFESAAYVARYIMKKVTGEAAGEHYADKDTGVSRTPEYTTMSRGGKNGHGIGYDWFERFSGDVFPDDSVILRGLSMKPPKYYDSIYEISDPDEYRRIKSKRRHASLEHAEDFTARRLRDRRICTEARLSKLPRRFEDEA